MLNSIVWFSLHRRGIVHRPRVCASRIWPLYLVPRQIRCIPRVCSTDGADPDGSAGGLSAEQVELLVTTPVETTINGVPEIESLRSGSIQGLSVITMTFRMGTDIYRARQVVAERLTRVLSQLPRGVKAPRHDAPYILNQHRPGRRPHVRHVNADGTQDHRGLDSAFAPALRSGRRQCCGLRRGCEAIPGPGRYGKPHAICRGHGRRSERGPPCHGRCRCRFHRYGQPAPGSCRRKVRLLPHKGSRLPSLRNRTV